MTAGTCPVHSLLARLAKGIPGVSPECVSWRGDTRRHEEAWNAQGGPELLRPAAQVGESRGRWHSAVGEAKRMKRPVGSGGQSV